MGKQLALMVLAGLLGCGESSRPGGPPDDDDPVKCLMPEAVCSASGVDSCSEPVAVVDCANQVDVDSGTAMVFGNLQGISDAGDPDGWVDLGFHTSGTQRGQESFATGVSHNNSGSTTTYTIVDPGRWLWSVEVVAIASADLEVDILVGSGCDVAKITGCHYVRPADGGSPTTVTIAAPALDLEAGDVVTFRAREPYDNWLAVVGWVQARRLN